MIVRTLTACFTACLFLSILCVATSRCLGDDNASPVQVFSAACAERQALEDRIKEILRKYPAADDDQKAQMLEQLGKAGQRARELMPTLQATALAAYREAPGESPEAVEILIESASEALERDDYASAAETTELLAKNKGEDEALDSLAGMAAYGLHDFESAKRHWSAAAEAGTISEMAARILPMLDEMSAQWEAEKAIRAKEAAEDNLPRVKLETNQGAIVLELYENEAPQTVGNFVNLVEKGFYDGLTFHRVLGQFMAQGGCPEGTGAGGPGYRVYCECEKEGFRRHYGASLSMAHAGRDTGGSQFFLTFLPVPHLDGRHTVFGRVIEGQDVLAKLQRINPGDPRAQGVEPDKIVKATVIRKRDHEYVPTKVEEKKEDE